MAKGTSGRSCSVISTLAYTVAMTVQLRMAPVLIFYQIVGLERHACMAGCTATPHNMCVSCLHLQTSLYSRFMNNSRLDLKTLEHHLQRQHKERDIVSDGL